MGINHLNTRGDRSQHNQNYDSDIFGQGQDYTSCMKKRKDTLMCLKLCKSILRNSDDDDVMMDEQRNTYSQDFDLGGGMGQQPGECAHCGFPLTCSQPRNYEQGGWFNQG